MPGVCLGACCVRSVFRGVLCQVCGCPGVCLGACCARWWMFRCPVLSVMWQCIDETAVLTHLLRRSAALRVDVTDSVFLAPVASRHF